MRWLAPLGGLGLLVAMAGAPQAGRTETPVVVEFFTSQGCSTCPPADAIFSELAQLPGVIALALHVDYWDYLGWKDPFGKPEHTDRQRAYARAHKERTIYTPQMIVQGQDLLKGHEEEAVRSRIAAHESGIPAVNLDLARGDGGLKIKIVPEDEPVGPAEVHVVEYMPANTMTVEGGENVGYHHTFTNIVIKWSTIGLWDGASPVTLNYEGDLGDNVAVLVQSPEMGSVLSAAVLP